MRKFMGLLRVLVLSTLVAFVFVPSVRAEDPVPTPDAWQATITSQIVAFREHDADAAFSFAAAPFHQAFTDSQQFFLAIVGSGYMPIMTSKSHSFGEYRVLDDGSVGQMVHFVDDDQSLYDAVYALALEGGAWRVVGVQLIKKPGLGV